ncbi:hypothetical protein A2818_01420 [Candidatus Nomurabacteria bacterium RIFCSPHIGHO2_01_FULL_40_12]|uniref:Thioredoxin domain-containing protein n=1 Tax=Candidatus Nomurabacteria bacterium RIFCSPHIGHO2_01_FULL_40_12 TaxID=1801737 RepID=A0A1F6V109_9BACT|nr:MAG: hypothetical protein A2818_01420 [Candidatus Nomurabacteria bacterium RIFCSPHIGHO2_01_FULL_40_12]
MQNNDQKQVAGAIILVGILIAGAILLKGTKAPENIAKNANDVNKVSQSRPVTSSDHILGNKNAKIIIVEYSDLECPFCKVFHNTMHKVIADNNKVAWVYRHYPIPQLHPKAFREAEATECAFEQGGNDAFWKYTDRLFEVTPSNNGLPEIELAKIAQYAGLNVASFNTCLDSGKYKDKVQKDIDDGNKAGVSGTPSSFILVNSKVVDVIRGAQPFEVVMQQLSQIK